MLETLGLRSGVQVREPRGVVSPYLDGVLGSVCCDLDATIAGSFDGAGQVWRNLAAQPADGAGAAAYDFYRGLDGTVEAADPAFSGTAGNAGAYFDLENTDFFNAPTASSAMPPTLQTVNRTVGGSAFWWAGVFRTPASWPVNTGFWGHDLTDLPTHRGVRFFYNRTNARFTLQQWNNSGAYDTHFSLGAALSVSTDYVAILSLSENYAAARLWLNSATPVATMAVTSLAESNAANTGFRLSAGGAALAAPGLRVYAHALGNDYLDDARVAAILTHYRTRHGRAYGL